jgi:hypothetical protein
VQPFPIRQGRTGRELIELRDESGAWLAGDFAGTEALTLAYWPGDNQPALADPASVAAWADPFDPDEPAVVLTHDEADTALMTPGFVRYVLTVSADGVSADAYSGLLEILPAAGSDDPPKTYCGFDTLRRLMPAVDQLITADDSAQTDFAEQRASARRWLDRQVMARARHRLEDRASGVLVSPPNLLPAEGWTGTAENIEARLDAIRAALDADGLTDPDGLVESIAAHYALAEVLRPQLGNVGESKTPWQALGGWHKGEAIRKLSGWWARVVLNPAEIDLDAEPPVEPVVLVLCP